MEHKFRALQNRHTPQRTHQAIRGILFMPLSGHFIVIIFKEPTHINNHEKYGRHEQPHQGGKIREKGSLVIGTMKTTIVCQVCHSYIHIQAITNEAINKKVVDISLVSATKQISCKKATYNA